MKIWGIDAIYSSCMQRTLETARPIFEQTQTSWYVWPALGETNRRGWPTVRESAAAGQPVEQSERDKLKLAHPNHVPLAALRDRFPTFIPDQPFSWPDEWWLPLEHESREQAYDRAEAVLHHLTMRYRDKDVRLAVVCHNAFGSVLLSKLMQCPPSDQNTFTHAHAAITAVDIFPTYNQVQFMNYVGHLLPEEITEGVHFAPCR